MDRLHLVGRSTHGTVERLEAEARRLGVSRRDAPRHGRQPRSFHLRRPDLPVLEGTTRLARLRLLRRGHGLRAVRRRGAGTITAELGGRPLQTHGRTERACGFFDADFELGAEASLPEIAGVLQRHGAGNLVVGGAHCRLDPVKTAIVSRQGFRPLDYEGLMRTEADMWPGTQAKGQSYADWVAPAAPARGGRLARLALCVQRPTTDFGRAVYDQVRLVPWTRKRENEA